jgi:Na+/H+ antiporter NhaC
MNNQKRALIPFFIFLITFILLHVLYPDATLNVKDNFAIFSVFIALLSAIFTFPEQTTFQKKIDIFIEGSAHSIIIHMCYIFLFSTVFTYILEKIGAIQAAVSLSLDFIPTSYILPGIFIVTSLFSLTIGSSMGAIAAFMPIVIEIARVAGIPLPLIAGTVMCGAMFGDNLSMLSDTTIAAVKITGCSMKAKFKLNVLIALPAFIGAILVLIYQNSFYTNTMREVIDYQATKSDFISLLPYLLVFGLALKGIDILAVLVAGIISATVMGIAFHTFTFAESITFIFDGFYQSKAMVHVFILVIFLSGLSKIIAHNGGLEYILRKAEQWASQQIHARFAIFFLVGFVNCAIAINTISIVLVGTIARKLGTDYQLKKAEVATILDIGSCVSQGILPYTPQMLLITSMAKISAVSILPYLWYQYFLLASLFSYFFYKKG